MEGVAFILIGVALFSHSWSLLGFYADARSLGVTMAGIAVALAVALFAFEPQFLGTLGDGQSVRGAETDLLKILIISWAIYAAIVGAQNLWDMEERPLGLYSVALTAVSFVSLAFFLQLWADSGEDLVMAPIVIITAMLSIIGALLFFSLAIPFAPLRTVSGWALLLQSLLIAGFGLGMAASAIST
jgi:hypothetical protein